MKVSDLSRASATVTTVPAPPFSWKTRILLPIVLVGATAALLVGTTWNVMFPGVSVRVVPVMVKTGEATQSGGGITASGWLEPDPFAFYVSALASGVVEEVLVLEGQLIEAGDVVARLVSEDACLELARAESELAAARADQARAEADLTSHRETLEHLIDRREDRDVAAAGLVEAVAALEQLGGEIAAEEARLATLEDEYERKKDLVASGAVSEGGLRRLALAVDAQKAAVEAVRQKRFVLDARKEKARSQLQAAKQQLELTIDERHAVALAEAQKQRADAAVAGRIARRDEAQLQLERMDIRTPVGGVVLRRLVSPGSRLITTNEPHAGHVIHLYDPKHLQARVDVPLADAAGVGVDQEAEVTVQVLPDRRFKGRVTRLVHEADIQKNTVEVKVSIEDPDVVLKPEMLARVKFLGQSRTTGSRQRLLAPERCIEDDNGTPRVWVVTERVQERGVAVRRAVELGGAGAEGWREIVDGLRPGDWLIPDPPAGLTSGDRITIEGEDER